MQVPHTTYGPGGYDPTKPNNNVLSTEMVEIPDPPPIVSMKALRSELGAVNSVAATRGVLAQLVAVLDPNDPTIAGP